MKELTNPRCTVLALLAIMAGTMRLLLADISCGTFYWGCAYAEVRIQNATWRQAACPLGTPTQPDSKDIPVITSKCGAIEGDGGGQAATVTFYYDENNNCVAASQGVPGTLSIDPGATGCKIEQ